jgi:hypothetical protein
MDSTIWISESIVEDTALERFRLTDGRKIPSPSIVNASTLPLEQTKQIE